MSNEKRTMTYIGKIDLLEKAYRKLLVGETLSYEEKSLLLATAICYYSVAFVLVHRVP